MYLVRPPYLLKKLFSKTVWRMLPSSGKTLYLTFDDGPIPEVTPWVLDLLKQYNAKATFFCVGNNVQKHPDIYMRILAEGHTTGNHTYTHVNGWRTSTPDYIKNIDRCAQLVESKLFRPPYGRLTRQQYEQLASEFEIIMWDVLAGDYDAKTSSEKCLRNVTRYTRNGSIIVFHDSMKAKRNLEATLPAALDHFSRQGYTFSSISL